MTAPTALRAHWLASDLFALPGEWEVTAPILRALVPQDRPTDQVIAQVPLEDAQESRLSRSPHRDGEVPGYLAAVGYRAWTAAIDIDEARDLARLELQVATSDGGATGVQFARLLDAIYPDAVHSAPLGATVTADGGVTLRLWAPTAREVSVEVLDVVEPEHGTVQVRRVVPALREPSTGVWTLHPEPSGSADPIAVGTAYRWLVHVYAPSTGYAEYNRVSDPYAQALTVNATASVVVDLANHSDPDLAPVEWLNTPAPRMPRVVDHMITELHVRDLSRDAVEIPESERGTYRAFTRDIPGTRHLRELATAGLTTVHLLPVYDIATIEEDRARWSLAAEIEDPAVLLVQAPDGTQQQQAVVEARDVARRFNWGYDPLHVMAPEGSYAVDAHGAARCGEVREMVGALHEMGLAVVLDQVFNHTHACGQDPTSVLCRIVPGYYSRLNPDGGIELSTCCPNVATEHAMAQRWMVDAVVHWARAYRVDGFRFDLMGHHSVENMLAVRAGLDALTLNRDGVDGAGILLYGEGWNFGEVADNARFTQAIQGQLAGTSIATFSDRLRDAITGGTPSDGSTLGDRGLATGLVEQSLTDAAKASELGRLTDLVRLGLAGNLGGIRFVNHDGSTRSGDEIPYAGQRAGYAVEPDEVLSYVDAHDNETLFDIFTLKLPLETPLQERVRRNTLALASVAWGQSASFWHAGTDLLRSKSLDTDSFDSGDWFNRIDWDGQSSTFGSGLPPQDANGERWETMRDLLVRPELRPDAAAIALAHEAALDLLRVRREVPLLRLGSSDLIRDLVSFPGAGEDATPGLVVMLIDDAGSRAIDLDPVHSAVLVVLNFSLGEVTQSIEGAEGRDFALAPSLQTSADPGVQAVGWSQDGVVTIPALTAAVLVEAR